MKNLLLILALLSTQLSAIPAADSKAYAIQYLVKEDGSIISTETILDTKTGSFVSVPLEGLLALFELWVYPLIGEDGSDALPKLMDSELVGVLPNIDINFTGRDPYQHPRTRADWSHEIDVVIHEPIGTTEDGGTPPLWMRSFLVRKRFLAEEFVGAADADEHWLEMDALPILHTQGEQTLSFSDDAYPPDLEDSDRWSGIIEYQVVADAIPESPIPYLQIAATQVRVWPKWEIEYQNFPTQSVNEIPNNLQIDVTDIYPGTQKVEVEYLFKKPEEENFDGVTQALVAPEFWTAIAPQPRQYNLTGLANKQAQGEYLVRVAMTYPWGVEYSYQGLNSASLDATMQSLPPFIQVRSNRLLFRGSINSLR